MPTGVLCTTSPLGPGHRAVKEVAPTAVVLPGLLWSTKHSGAPATAWADVWARWTERRGWHRGQGHGIAWPRSAPSARGAVAWIAHWLAQEDPLLQSGLQQSPGGPTHAVDPGVGQLEGGGTGDGAGVRAAAPTPVVDGPSLVAAGLHDQSVRCTMGQGGGGWDGPCTRTGSHLHTVATSGGLPRCWLASRCVRCWPWPTWLCCLRCLRVCVRRGAAAAGLEPA